MSNFAKGFETIFGFKRNSNTWGSGHAVVLGSGDGIELNSEGLTIDSQLVENEAVSGAATQLPGEKGNEFHSGPVSVDFFYRGVEVMVANCFGSADAPVQQGGSACYLHTYRIAENHEGVEGTMVRDNSFATFEYPHTKFTSLECTWENGKQGKLSIECTPFSLNINQGTADDDFFVVAVLVANGAYTIAAGTPTYPGHVTVTVTDANVSITQHIITFVGTDEDDKYITFQYKLATDGLTWTSVQRVKTIVSATGSATAGTVTAVVDVVKIGVMPGKNNSTTVSSITLPSDRDWIMFSHMRVFMNAQTGAAFDELTSTDEYFPSSFNFKIDLMMAKDDVTTRFHFRPDEPLKDGFVKVTGGLNFSKLGSENVIQLRKRLSLAKQKLMVVFTGPICDSPYPYKMVLWFNNCQFTAGTANVDGPKRVPMDLQFEAKRALTTPTGFTSGYTKAVTMDLYNKRTTSALA